MVNPEITDSSNTPQSFHPGSVPHLTINHDVAADLDSTNAFEGPEKLLEVWFAPSPSALPAGARPDGLKAVPAANWEVMLDMVNCKVLSVVRSDAVDAYLLSESSMFVFPHKLILKTCGTTTLLLGLHRLLQTAAVDAGFPAQQQKQQRGTDIGKCASADGLDVSVAATPYRVFYSRKSFLFPDRQRGPHRSWKQEVRFLDDMFEGGSAYMVGKFNGDHWYLYTTSPNASMLTPPLTPTRDDGKGAVEAAREERQLNGDTHKISPALLSRQQALLASEDDETLEILMTDLDPELAKQFYLSHASAVACQQDPAGAQKAREAAHDSLGELDGSNGAAIFPVEGIDDASGGSMDVEGGSAAVVAEALTTEGHALGTVVSDSCGLSEVYPRSKYPDARIDAYMFGPCGFSANGVVPAPAPAPAPVVKDGSGQSSSSSAAHYFTVHVTPEPHCSFASFETNVPGGQKGRETSDIIEHVVGIFRPGRFSVTLFEGKAARRRGSESSSERGSPPGGGDGPDDDSSSNVQVPPRTRTVVQRQRVGRIPGYRRIDRIVYDLDDYDLIFRYYQREDWSGDGAARLGEDY